MGVLQLGKFTGIFPRLSARYLPDNAAQTARNVKLFSGEIRAWMRPLEEYTPKQEGVVSIYKMQGPGQQGHWCEWTCDTDVVRGPVADAEDYRVYYSEDGVCKKTNWEMCTSNDRVPGPAEWLYMGVPAPQGALTLTAERTMIPSEENPEEMVYDADNTENRVYVYTYVSTFGSVKEESAPSDPADVVCDIEGHPVKVSGFVDPPTDHLNITGIRLYRVVTGSSTATYMLVDEFELEDHKFPSSGLSSMGVLWEDGVYEDNLNVIDLGKELDTLNFTEPPEGLRGLVSMPNGFLAGFVYNQIWFSEPYLPYAWPSDYMLTVDSRIVGLGVYGSTLVVCTEAQPYTISGTHPSSMTQEKQPMNQPCVSKQSIAYDQYGVIYSSPHGLVAMAGGQMDVFTRSIMTRDDWQEYSPSLVVAAMYNNMYIGSYHTGDIHGTFVIARNDTPEMIELDFSPQAMHVEYGTGSLYCLNSHDQKIYKMDASAINRMTFEWKSKAFQYNMRQTFTCAKVCAHYADNDIVMEWEEARKQAVELNKVIWQENLSKGLQGAIMDRGMLNIMINGSLMKFVPEPADMRNAALTIYADGEEVITKSLTKEESFRIPATTGYTWEVRVAGTMDIYKVVLATSMIEMKAA